MDSFLLLFIYDAKLFNGINVRYDEEWHFTIKNFGSRPLYIIIFNLDPLWKASNYILNIKEEDFIVVLLKEEGNNGKKKIYLKIKVLKAL